MEVSMRCVLSVALLWTNTAAHSDIHLRPENSLHIALGQKLELRCGAEGAEGAEGDEALGQFWRTPFGQFDGCNQQNKDPVHTCNGTLRISRATYSHDGLYYCIRMDETSKTIVPYRVSIVKNQRRKSRQVRDTVSESRFAAAVASSVIVSFLVAFTLGAFTRSYVMRCLRTIQARMPHRKHNHTHNSQQRNTQATRAQTSTVFFHTNQTTGEDAVDIGSVHQEHVDVDNEDGDESNEPQGREGEEHTSESRSVVSPHPKKKTRVIKVYNYDEEGNPFSHIRDSRMEGEDEVSPRLRTRSLTRLNAIMKQAEDLHIHPDTESTDDPSHDAPEEPQTD